jgi:hypothetical protein
VAVNLTVTDPVAVKAGATFDLTYSVQWVRSDVPFEQRFSRYIDNDLRRTQVRWFGVVNSALMAVFLCGTVALILLRTLRADFARYIRDEEEEGGGGGNALVTGGGASSGSVIDKAMGDETGWQWEPIRHHSIRQRGEECFGGRHARDDEHGSEAGLDEAPVREGVPRAREGAARRAGRRAWGHPRGWLTPTRGLVKSTTSSEREAGCTLGPRDRAIRISLLEILRTKWRPSSGSTRALSTGQSWAQGESFASFF